MEEKNQPKSTTPTGLETLQDIKRIMERSTRFVSLSGLSGLVAGLCALAGAWFAKNKLHEYRLHYEERNLVESSDFYRLETDLFITAALVLIAALGSSFYLTWRKTRENHLPFWDHTSKKLLINITIPLIAGGLFILAMLQYDEWRFIVPACLIFYGLALLNASKYTLIDVRYLGIIEIIIGLISTQFIDYGLYFWAGGFGVIHVFYGIVMWRKYERNQDVVI